MLVLKFKKSVNPWNMFFLKYLVYVTHKIFSLFYFPPPFFDQMQQIVVKIFWVGSSLSIYKIGKGNILIKQVNLFPGQSQLIL